jgi:hypothetical protein
MFAKHRERYPRLRQYAHASLATRVMREAIPKY